MIYSEKFFEQLTEIKDFDKECRELLNKIMELSSPMMFNNDFASDKDLDKLISELDRFNLYSRDLDMFVRNIENMPPCQTSRLIFI